MYHRRVVRFHPLLMESVGEEVNSNLARLQEDPSLKAGLLTRSCCLLLQSLPSRPRSPASLLLALGGWSTMHEASSTMLLYNYVTDCWRVLAVQVREEQVITPSSAA